MKFNICILPGDGIGPEIVKEAVKVIGAIEEAFKHRFVLNHGYIGHDAIQKTGCPLPDETLQKCLEADAVLLGAVGDPSYDNNPNAKVRPEQGLLKLRKELGLYTNIRPVNIYKELSHLSPLKEERIKGTDFVILRELIEGIYFGEPRGRNEEGTKAFDTCVYSSENIEKIIRQAFELASSRKKKLCLVDKANVLATSRLWREIGQKIAVEFPEIEFSCMFVDNAAMQLIQNPSQFDVIVTENMFGDILSDEASVLPGSLGLLPSASVGSKTAVYEPIHGSFPQAKGKNEANPIATIASLAMLFEVSLNLKEEAQLIREAIQKCIENKILTKDLISKNFYKTSDIGDYIKNEILTRVEKEVEIEEFANT